MASFPKNNSWRPPYGYSGVPHKSVVFTSNTDVRRSPWDEHGKDSSLFVARFLEHVLSVRDTADLMSDVSFLYVLLSREPGLQDSPAVYEDGAISEFGFGEAPAAPDEWSSVPLRDLLISAIAWLKRS